MPLLVRPVTPSKSFTTVSYCSLVMRGICEVAGSRDTGRRRGSAGPLPPGPPGSPATPPGWPATPLPPGPPGLPAEPPVLPPGPPWLPALPETVSPTEPVQPPSAASINPTRPLRTKLDVCIVSPFCWRHSESVAGHCSHLAAHHREGLLAFAQRRYDLRITAHQRALLQRFERANNESPQRVEECEKSFPGGTSGPA